jgi:hypothetical protein
VDSDAHSMFLKLAMVCKHASRPCSQGYNACCQPPLEVQQLPGTLSLDSCTATCRLGLLMRAPDGYGPCRPNEVGHPTPSASWQCGVVAGPAVVSPAHSQSHSCRCECEGCPSQHTLSTQLSAGKCLDAPTARIAEDAIHVVLMRASHCHRAHWGRHCSARSQRADSDHPAI